MTRLRFKHKTSQDKYGYWWACYLCVCGNKTECRMSAVKRELVKSCGCLRVERGRAWAAGNVTHGDGSAGVKRAAEYKIWDAIKQRCTNPRQKFYSYYGGRGISVCERWNNSYECFLADMGRRPSADYSIDRICNDGNYEPGNCRWATKSDQLNNTRRTVRVYIGGKELSLKEWSVVLGLKYPTVQARRRSGWTDLDALLVPTKGRTV